MGNNASTPQQPGGGAAQSSTSSSSKTPGRGSPRTRNIPLPAPGDDYSSARDQPRSRQQSSGSERKGSVRKLPTSTRARDSAHGSSPASTNPSSPRPSPAQQPVQQQQPVAVVASPSSTTTTTSPPLSKSAAGLGLLGSVGGPRRKLSDRVPIVNDSEEVDNDAPEEGTSGTLRGALQGKAEHVVYGPRRGAADYDDDGSRAVLLNPPSAAQQETLSKPVGIAIPGTGPTAIPLRTPGGGGTGARGDASLTNAGMGAIGATPIMDPDDTTHPGFGASARLTSAVMASTDRMPVVNSPRREDLPSGSPFTRGAGGAEGDSGEATTPTPADSDTAASTAAPTPSHSHEMLLDPAGSRRQIATPQTSFAGAFSTVLAPTSPQSTTPTLSSTTTETHQLPVPHTSSPTPPIAAPNDTVQAPPVPDSALPIASDEIPSGTSVIASPPSSVPGSPIGVVPSPAVLLPPAVFNAPVAAIPIPLLSVPSETVAKNLIAAAVDLGAGDKGVPTLIKWKDEDGQEKPDEGKGRKAKGPKEVFVTGTFAKGWKTKIELRKTDASDFSALISLPPGPHRLKFIVDDEWKASKHLPVATDADGNLINYLQVNAVNSKLPPNIWQPPVTSSTLSPPSASAGAGAGTAAYNAAAAAAAAAGSAVAPSSTPTNRAGQLGAGLFWPFGGDDEDPSLAQGGSAITLDVDEDDTQWTQEIPSDLVKWGEWEAERDAIENHFYAQHPNGPSDTTPPPEFPPPPPFAGVQPPSLPAQLEKGPLNHAAYVTQGSGDDNSILPKPDHSVINHLAASPIKGGFLSVGVTTRYKRKVYYKALSSR
ncbi:hypothetical protein JCM10908_003729 [Rhodotorula pacifica]|uniref:uncharacterized protein n=1 Tax=Rhodotorula pacifica TaxID=1495444 RepID=UPI00317A57D3